MSAASGTAMEIHESAIPVRPATRTACKLVGLDPLHVANEWKLVAVVSDDIKNDVLSAMRAHHYDRNAAVIGQAKQGRPRVLLETAIGTTRVVRLPAGEIPI